MKQNWRFCTVNVRCCCDSSEYQDVIIDNKLSFQSYIHAIENKVARAVGILSKVRYLFPSSTLLFLYFALIHLHLLFGLVLRGNTYSTYIAKLPSLQNKAIRIVFNCKYQNPITPHFYNLGVLKICWSVYFCSWKNDVPTFQTSSSSLYLLVFFSYFFGTQSSYPIHNQEKPVYS